MKTHVNPDAVHADDHTPMNTEYTLPLVILWGVPLAASPHHRRRVGVPASSSSCQSFAMTPHTG